MTTIPKTIKTRVQLLKNTDAYFSAKNPVTLNGEIYLVMVEDGIKIKIGDGQKYNDISFWTQSQLENFGVKIADPKANQILIFDSEDNVWKNVNFADDTSIIYLTSAGLSIKGYADASVGQMLVKDQTNGLAWIDPVSTTTLESYTELAKKYSEESGNSATTAATKAAEAATSASTAETINSQTVSFIENKFWWGTLAEYNALTQLDEGTFYFVKPES